MAWTTLDDCESALFNSYNSAFSDNDTLGYDISDAKSDFANVTGINTWLYKTVEHMLAALDNIHKVFNHLLIRDITETRWYIVPHTLHVVQDTFLTALTWKDIIKAYGDASDPGKMWLVTESDWMRKQMWRKNTNIKWQESPFE